VEVWAVLKGIDEPAITGISLALNDYGPDEVPDLTPRPLDEPLAWTERANEHRDHARFSLTAGSADQPRAFKALVLACIVAGDVANRIAGNIDLSVTAARRGYDRACRHGNPALIGFTRWCWQCN
jgi:hypothetical protein